MRVSERRAGERDPEGEHLPGPAPLLLHLPQLLLCQAPGRTSAHLWVMELSLMWAVYA